VRYLQHPEHSNVGKAASRNLGIQYARGEYVAFLDADDVWLPHKLEEQVSILDSVPEAGLLYGETLYWYSWTKDPHDLDRDFVPPLGVQSNTLVRPPKLLPLFLRGKAAVPCTCSIMVRRSVIDEIGVFDETGPKNIYEDQAFYAMVCLNSPVYVSSTCWDLYRQHPDASMATVYKSGQETAARQFFLKWLEGYLEKQEVNEVEVWQALRRELWRMHYPVWLPCFEGVRNFVRWAKKWILRFEERLLPAKIRHWLWA
jgi:glycosyltransferase involved in cell wall biosynthesis